MILPGLHCLLLSLGLYVDNFVYFYKDPAVEALFCRVLSTHYKVDFMDIIDWFLGVHFPGGLLPRTYWFI